MVSSSHWVCRYDIDSMEIFVDIKILLQNIDKKIRKDIKYPPVF